MAAAGGHPTARVELRGWLPDFSDERGDLVDGRVMLFIGRRGSGKTTAQRCALRECQRLLGPRLDYGICMSRTSTLQKAGERWDNFVPREFIIPEHSEEAIRSVMERQRRLIEALGRTRAPFAFIVSDDCATDLDRSPALVDLLNNGRHYKIIALIAAQDAINLSRRLRGQVDYTFLLRENQLVNLDLLYDNYCSVLPKEQLFALLRQLWGRREILVTDNTAISMDVGDAIKVFAPTAGVRFRAGSARFWVSAIAMRLLAARATSRAPDRTDDARVIAGGRVFVLPGT